MSSVSKIAIISDIHGNLPALQSVLSDIQQRQVNSIICLGDMIGKGPHSKDVFEICLKQCQEIVRGNWEDFISDPATEETPFIQFYRNQLGEENLEKIRQLPAVTGFWMSGKYVRLFHANPHSVYHRVYSESPLEKRLELFETPQLKSTETEQCLSEIVGYGDIHGGYLQHLDGGRVLFNVGSVGNSCDSIPMAAYTILEGKVNEREETDFSIQFYRVKYDRSASIAQAMAVQIPDQDAYINEIKTGLYCR